MQRRTRGPWGRFGLPEHVGWLVVAGYGVAAGLITASSIWHWHGAVATRPVDEVVTLLCVAATGTCASYAAYREAGRRRLGWLGLATAMFGWAAGEFIWAVYDVRPEVEHATHPAGAEIVGLLYPVGAMTSLVLLSHLNRNSPRRLVLDGLIVWTSLFVVSWVYVLDKQLREDTGSRPATLVHVFNDVVLMTTALIMLSRSRSGDRPSRGLLACGILTISAADIGLVFHTGLGSYHTGDLADLGRVAGLAFVALATLCSVTESPVEALLAGTRYHVASRVRLWVPYVPLLLAAGIGLGHVVGKMKPGPMVGALGVLVVAVLARQFVVLVENQGLLSKATQEAFRDSLTGLANRTQFLHHLEQAVFRRSPDAAPIAVLCLDLDDFKSVNDALGHPAGDELLIRVAERLTAAVGETGTVARLGGDEFAVLVEGSVEASQAVAHRVLQGFSGAIVIDGVPISVRPSIGFTVASPTSSCTVDQLLRHADLAMYAAKREGGQCVRSFVPDLPFPYTFPTDSESSGETPIRTLQPMLDAVAAASSAPPQPDRHGDVSDGLRWPPTTVRIAFAALIVGVIAFAAFSVAHPHARHDTVFKFFADFWYPLLNLSAAGLIALRAYRITADRLAWLLIATGMASSALGDVIYVLWVPDGQSPSVADPPYLAYYPLVYAGLLVLTQARLKRVPIPIRMDSVVCGLAAAALSAALMAGPVHRTVNREAATVLVGLAYSWGDLILLALAASILPMVGWRNEFRWGLLIAGFILFAVADTDYLFETAEASYRVGTLLDTAWPIASLLVAMASWAPWPSGAPLPKRGLGSYAVPVACTVVALGVVVLAHDSLTAATLAALSLTAVAARFAITFRDVSSMAENHQHAMTDELTGLPNRRSMATALTAAADSALPAAPFTVRVPTRRALLLLNLHEFKEINESVGRHFADELLRHIADRLSGCVRREDLLARAGDDQFAILLAEGADLIAARAQAVRLIEALSEPFALDLLTVQVDGRIAIALYPDHCDHSHELLNRAETAIPHAESTKSKIAVYHPAFELFRDNDPNLITELRTALLDGDGLTCHYQPKINASDGTVHSVEALLRWHHPSRGLLLPQEFLPAAERAGLMRRVANRAINLALEQIQTWRERGIATTVAVNLSTTNLLDLDLVGTLERLLRIHSLPADALIVEITESALVDSVRSRNTVAALQRLGVRISLDDYGTGWSSLARLQDVSVDELKLDRVFVARLAQDPRSVAIVRSTVALARSLNADLVAEGVEDEVTLDALRRYGCTITQGFVHSPPLPADELERWIASHAANPGSRRSEQAGVNE